MNTKHLFLKLLCTVAMIAVYVVAAAGLALVNIHHQWMSWGVLVLVSVCLWAVLHELWSVK